MKIEMYVSKLIIYEFWETRVVPVRVCVETNPRRLARLG
jgi:hypothetical protein